jgi:hypothetical protein
MSSSFDFEACRRLPLAEAVLRLLDFTLADRLLDDVFARHRAQSYHGVICFSSLVQLLTEGMFGQQRSAHRTFQRAISEGRIDASLQAVYGKLRRMPISLSLGLFDAATEQLRTVLGAKVARPLPASLQAFWALAFDGKKLKHVLHRLKPLRGLKGNIYGGKLLVVQDMATAQAVAIAAVADGETADNPLVPDVIARVRRLPSDKPRLWLADRAFCEFQTLALLAEAGDAFVVRHNAACKFRPDDNVPTQTGIDREGRSYTQQWGWLGKNREVRCRKITVDRPGQQPFTLVTNLEDAERYPADDLLDLYRRRWGIETMFQQVVQTFDLRHLIGGTPQATIFQAILCFLVYNLTLTIRDFVATTSGQDATKISTTILFDDVADELTSLLKVVDTPQVIELFAERPLLDTDSLRAYLLRLLANVWRKGWTKASTRKQSAERKPRAYLCGGHTSVHKILRGEHQEIPFTTDEKPYETKKHV